MVGQVVYMVAQDERDLEWMLDYVASVDGIELERIDVEVDADGSLILPVVEKASVVSDRYQKLVRMARAIRYQVIEDDDEPVTDNWDRVIEGDAEDVDALIAVLGDMVDFLV